MPVIVSALLAGIAGAEPSGDLDTKRSEAEAVKADLDHLNGELEAKVESYNVASAELESIRGSIASNEIKLEETQASLNENQNQLDERIVGIYKNDSTDMLDVLMETSDLTDFLTTYDMLTKLSEQDRDDVEQVKMLKQMVEEAKVQLEQDYSAQESTVTQLEADRSGIETGISERNEMLSGIEGEIASLEAEQRAAEAAAFAAQVAANEEASASDDSSAGSEEDLGPAPASTAGGVVDIAMQYLGVPYVWGGASPSGFDCSGLVMYVYSQIGISLPHSAAGQYSSGTPIDYDELAAGDLVFFGDGGINHVGIYIGGGSMIHAPFEGETVQVASVSDGGSYRGACRL